MPAKKTEKRSRKRLPVVFMVAMLFSFLTFFQLLPVFAGVLDSSRKSYQSLIIDHSITFDRVYSLESKIVKSGGTDQSSINQLRRFSNKTVFWKGRVCKFLEYPDNYWILLKTGKGRYFWVYAKKSIRNLDHDRTGYVIGVKGNLLFRNNKLSYLKAKSVVIVSPPEVLSYKNFIKKYSISSRVEVNTNLGKVVINNRYLPFILHRIYIHNPHYPWKTVKMIGSGIVYQCERFNVDPLLVTAMINVESAFDMDAVSSSGAIGLGQLMPSTAASLGVDPYDPHQNIGGAVRYLKNQLQRWRGYTSCTKLALASYNAGPGAVARYGGIPPFSETRNYVFFIQYLLEEYKREIAEEGSVVQKRNEKF